jgi:hypothetical protein
MALLTPTALRTKVAPILGAATKIAADKNATTVRIPSIARPKLPAPTTRFAKEVVVKVVTGTTGTGPFDAYRRRSDTGTTTGQNTPPGSFRPPAGDGTTPPINPFRRPGSDTSTPPVFRPPATGRSETSAPDTSTGPHMVDPNSPLGKAWARLNENLKTPAQKKAEKDQARKDLLDRFKSKSKKIDKDLEKDTSKQAKDEKTADTTKTADETKTTKTDDVYISPGYDYGNGGGGGGGVGGGGGGDDELPIDEEPPIEPPTAAPPTAAGPPWILLACIALGAYLLLK